MQTFLSEPTFGDSIKALDNKRLNKQLLEGRQILTAIAGESKGWTNHPATNMWRGYEQHLGTYLKLAVEELDARGIETAKNKSGIYSLLRMFPKPASMAPSWWYGEEKARIIATHRANLYLKDPDYYAQYAHDAIDYELTLDKDPESLVCCATRRQGKPCGYYWPSHRS